MSSDDIHLPASLASHLGESFPWDLVVLFVLAVVLGFKLYRVLGRKVGMQGIRQERPGQQRPSQDGIGIRFGRRARTAQDGASRALPPPLPSGRSSSSEIDIEVSHVDYEIPAPATRVGTVLGDITVLVPGFSPQSFLKEAEASFRQVVPAFAAGDTAVIEKALTPEALEVFTNAIKARSEAGETQRSDLRGVESLSILDATFANAPDANGEGRKARIEVRIVSRQVNLLTDRAGEPVLGTEAVTEFHDLWLFERGEGRAADRWRVAATRPA